MEDPKIGRLKGWLRRRLPVPDRDRGDCICSSPHTLWNEEMSRHLVEELQDLQLFDPGGTDVLDKLPPITNELQVTQRARVKPLIS